MTQEHEGAVFWRPGIAIPFFLTALIWGSTWLVIKDQLAVASPAWSVAWRFSLAAAGMFVVAAWSRKGLRLTPRDQLMAIVIGLTQFSFNFNLVYVAEIHVTSGVVAVLFALLLVPNAVLAWLFVGQRITPQFLVGSLIAIAGVALLLVHEAGAAELTGMVWLGLGLTALAILSVSVANIIHLSERAKAIPIYTLTAWAMFWGALANTAYALISEGVPVLPTEPRYWAGLAYLALVGSVVTFPLYFKLLREMGAGRAAYNGILIPIVAMALSTVFEGYRWSGLAIGGAVLGLAGLLVALKGRRTR